MEKIKSKMKARFFIKFDFPAFRACLQIQIGFGQVRA